MMRVVTIIFFLVVFAVAIYFTRLLEKRDERRNTKSG